MCFFVFQSLFTKKKHDKTWQDTRTIFVEVRRYKSPSGNYNEWCISWGWRWWCLWWCRRNFGCDRGRSAVRPSFRIYMDLRIVDIAVAVVIDLNMWDHVGVTTLIDWYSQVVNSCIFFFATRVRYSRVSVLFNLRTAAVPHRIRFFCIVQKVFEWKTLNILRLTLAAQYLLRVRAIIVRHLDPLNVCDFVSRHVLGSFHGGCCNKRYQSVTMVPYSEQTTIYCKNSIEMIAVIKLCVPFPLFYGPPQSQEISQAASWIHWTYVDMENLDSWIVGLPYQFLISQFSHFQMDFFHGDQTSKQ